MSSPEGRKAARDWELRRLANAGPEDYERDAERAGAQSIGAGRIDGRYYHPDGTPKTPKEMYGPGTRWNGAVVRVTHNTGFEATPQSGLAVIDIEYPRPDFGYPPPPTRASATQDTDHADPGFSDPAKERERIGSIIRELLA